MKTTALFLALLAMITLSAMAAFAAPIKCAGCDIDNHTVDQLKLVFSGQIDSVLPEKDMVAIPQKEVQVP